MLISWLSIYVIRRRVAKWGLMDQPNDRKVHVMPIPLGGGLGIWLGVVITFLIGTLLVLLNGSVIQFLPDQFKVYVEGLETQLADLWVLLIAGTALMLVGLVDDLRGLSWKLRLAIQFIVATACVVLQEWYFTAFVPYRILTVICTVFWIVMLINYLICLTIWMLRPAGVAVICSIMLVLYVVCWSDVPRTAVLCCRASACFHRFSAGIFMA